MTNGKLWMIVGLMFCCHFACRDDSFGIVCIHTEGVFFFCSKYKREGL